MSAWPSGANELLNALSLSDSAVPFPTGDEDMLTLMIDAVQSGIDIRKQYPDFYRKLLTQSDLREHFLDLLEAIDLAAADALEAVPSQPNLLAAFWQRVMHPHIEQFWDNQWRVTLSRTCAQLQQLFEVQVTSDSAFVYRNPDLFLDDVYLDLVHDEIVVNDEKLNVFLQAKQPFIDANNLELDLWVYVVAGGELPELTANLRWGSYDQRLPLPKNGRLHFPTLPLAAVFDAETEQVTAELHFMLSTLS